MQPYSALFMVDSLPLKETVMEANFFQKLQNHLVIVKITTP
jgi:hypothetical protein